jgi:tetraacyldisaccharide 4'-kinase
VIVGRDRTAAARRAIELGATVVVADDGLQHLRLARDFEIVVIDGERRFGNGQLLPAGPLRESPRRLASVDAIVVNEAYAGALHTGAAYIGAGDAGAGDTAAADTGAANAGAADTPPIRAPAFRMRLAPEPLKPLFAGGRELPLAAWRGEYVHAVAGLGNPERFFALLRGAGLEVREHSFPDHHQFVASDLDFADGRAIIMTEKDAVKCAGFRLDRAWYLPVSAELEQGARLLARIESLLAACPASGRAQNEGS